MLSQQLQSVVAIHEAGHAVAAHVLGATVTELSICPDAQSFGRAYWDGASNWRDQILILLAGAVAEVRCSLEYVAGLAGDERDLEQVDELLKRHSARPARDLAEALQRAAALVARHKLSIQDLGALLLKSNHLKGPELATALESVTR